MGGRARAARRAGAGWLGLPLPGADGQGAHLLGLALSRAWALRGLAGWVPDAAADRLRAAADEQEGAVLAHITDGDFMATHWLVSFALLAQDGLGSTVSPVGEGRAQDGAVGRTVSHDGPGGSSR